MEPSRGFPPVARHDAEILILGSLPGQRSLAAQQYYAHPRNAFWPIMESLFGIRGRYEHRIQQLAATRIALWDVLGSAERPGSLDARIRSDSARCNDIGDFLRSHSEVRLIAFNGRKAEQLFNRFIDGRGLDPAVRRRALPSTSPAYAAMSFSGKLMRWREALAPAED